MYFVRLYKRRVHILCTLDIIKALLKSERKTQQELCQYLGVSKQAFTEWNGGRNTSYKKYLPQIAEFFGVSVDYLLGKTEQKEKSPSVSDEEIKFALFGGGEITDEMWAEVKRYAEFVKQKYGK